MLVNSPMSSPHSQHIAQPLRVLMLCQIAGKASQPWGHEEGNRHPDLSPKMRALKQFSHPPPLPHSKPKSIAKVSLKKINSSALPLIVKPSVQAIQRLHPGKLGMCAEEMVSAPYNLWPLYEFVLKLLGLSIPSYRNNLKKYTCMNGFMSERGCVCECVCMWRPEDSCQPLS